MSPSWYDVLGVDPSATDEEVRAAWREGIAGLDPTDRRFRSLNRAAEVLLDPARRAAYDAELAAEPDPEPDPESDPESQPESRPEPEPRPTGATGATAAAGGRPARRAVPTWLLVALAGSVLVAGGALAFLLGSGRASALTEDREASARQARTAAEQAIVPVLSYDHRTLDEDRAAAHSYLTSRYRALYDKTFSIVEENADEVQPVVTARLVSSGIRRTGDDRVEVVMFVDQETVRRGETEPVVFQNYVTVTMQEVDGEWLVDELETQG